MLLPCGKHLYDGPFVPSLANEGSCMCIRGIDCKSVSTIFLLYFGPVQTVWYISIRCWTCSGSVIFFY
jgi:hypothetical protein